MTIAVANGDLSKKITVDVRGEILQLKDTMNTMVEQLRSFAAEVTRVAREVGTEGKLKQRMNVPGIVGGWADEVAAINTLIDDLVWPTTEVTRAIGSVAAIGPSSAPLCRGPRRRTAG